ncbi:unnamed protein product, partial [Polarella glacialis]
MLLFLAAARGSECLLCCCCCCCIIVVVVVICCGGSECHPTSKMEKLTLLTRGQAVGLGQSKEDLAHQLSVLGRRGEQSAADHGYAASVANMASDREEEVAARAIAALGDMGQEGAKHLDVVADGLTRGPKVCVAAAIAIGQFGRQAARCEDQLVRCMDSGEEAVRAAAIAALGAIGAEKQALVISKLLDDPCVSVAGAACQ